MEKINIAKILKDCPKGMELDCLVWNNIVFEGIDYDNIVISRKSLGSKVYLTQYGEINSIDGKCIIFPKGKTTWEGFVPPCKFKDGDIVYVKSNERNEYIIIFKEIKNDHVHKYACFAYQHLSIDKCALCHLVDVEIMRLATEEEREKLFQSIKENGYRWNPETKTLEKLIEPELKDGDIIFTHTGKYTWISIFKQFSRNSCCTHINLCINDNDLIIHTSRLCNIEEITTQRLATAEEKQKLFLAIKDNGYKWNEETKTLEKLPKFKVGDRIILKYNPHNIPSIRIKEVTKTQYILENGEFFYIKNSTEEKYVLEDKFDITTLVPFESKVLVRQGEHDIWKPAYWGKYDKNVSVEYPFITSYGSVRHCIPYKDNELLLGTTDDCEEHFKTWEQ